MASCKIPCLIWGRFRRALPLLGLLALLVASAAAGEIPLRWTMLNVTPAQGQADCHLLQMPDGRYVLVDIADAWDATGTALAKLKQRGVTRLALVVISHFHKDHYGRLLDLVGAGILVDRVALNVPDKRIADREIPWGCDWTDVQAVLAGLRTRGIPFFTPKAGDRLLEVKGADGIVAGIDVVCCYDGVNTPVGETDVNDTSIILRVFDGPTRALFTGDLNRGLGEYLAAGSLDVKADVLKAPHHGTEGAAPDEFFDRVGARAVLVPAPKALWETGRSMRIRNYFADRKIPAYVSGIRGDVTVVMDSKGYVIETER